MTERKPLGVSFETWIDRQIREATERGEFDNLPGAGKPIPGGGKQDDEMWWIKRKMQEENLSFPLPGTLALRKDAEDSRAAAVDARTEAEARKIIDELNARIRVAHGKPLSGPPVFQPTLDVEEVLAEWRERHPVEDPPASSEPPTRRRRSFFRRGKG
ncbi:DUF1992 domain-containing protein [Streptosporangium sp. NPDC020145]|uniref:DnaJ family domain-containing protein n=1 Tax=Streptosporangium sp. NPDC020145 TaxID=3154694 RepID=UPI00343B9B9F